MDNVSSQSNQENPSGNSNSPNLEALFSQLENLPDELISQYGEQARNLANRLSQARLAPNSTDYVQATPITPPVVIDPVISLPVGLPQFSDPLSRHAESFLQQFANALNIGKVPTILWTAALLQHLPLEVTETLIAIGINDKMPWQAASEKFLFCYGKKTDMFSLVDDFNKVRPSATGDMRQFALDCLRAHNRIQDHQVSIMNKLLVLPTRVQDYLKRNVDISSMDFKSFCTTIIQHAPMLNSELQIANRVRANFSQQSFENVKPAQTPFPDSKPLPRPPWRSRPDNSSRRFAVKKIGSHEFITTAKVFLNQSLVEAELDTAAGVSLISSQLADRLTLPRVKSTECLGTFVPGLNHTVKEMVPNAQLMHNGFLIKTNLFILEEMDFDLLLGAPEMHHLGFAISQTFNCTTLNEEEEDSFLNSNCDNEINNRIHCYSQYFPCIEKALSKNNDISPSSFCNLPNSIVRLNTGDSKPVFKPQHPPIPHALYDFVDEKIQNWKDTGRIEPCAYSPYHSSILLAEKKLPDGTLALERLCVNPKHLNSQLIDESYPIPMIKDLLQKVKGCDVFSTIDLRESFLQFKLHEDDRKKTAFTWNGRLYQFVGAPFGLKNLTFHVQRVMSELLLGCADFAFVYVDDIIIYSRTPEEHIQHLNEILNLLNKANLKIKEEKCKFFHKSILALGHNINGHGIKPNPVKVQEVIDWETPRSLKQLQSFMGLVNYFRDYIPNFAMLASPLDKIRNNAAFNFNDLTEEQLLAIQKLKEALVSSTILSFPNEKLPFKLATDASNSGIGAVLFQGEGNDTKFIGFASRSLRDHETRYSVPKREILALMFGLRYFHQYIRGRKFTLFTDNKAISYLNDEHNQSIVLNAWMDTIFTYNFNLVHIAGIENFLPDKLSRLYSTDTDPKTPHLCVKKLTTTSKTQISKEEKEERMQKIHLLGHFGAVKMHKALQADDLSWENALDDCKEFTKSCHICQRYNKGRRGFHPLRQISAKNPFDHVAIDLAGPLTKSIDNNEFVLILVDYHSRFCILKPLKTKTSKEVAETLFDIFCLFGFPKILQSDNGSEFINSTIKELTILGGIDHRIISSYYPRANGAAENLVDSVKTTLGKLTQGEEEFWDKYLSSVQFFINNKIHDAHQSKPFDVLFLRPTNDFGNFKDSDLIPLDCDQISFRSKLAKEVIWPEISKDTTDYQEKVQRNFVNSHKIITENLAPNTEVYIEIASDLESSLGPRYDGPYFVSRRKLSGNYALKTQTGRELTRGIPIAKLKIVKDTSSTSEGGEDRIDHITKIIGHRKEKGKLYFLVEWSKGPSPTWVKYSNVPDYKSVRKYWKKKLKSPFITIASFHDSPSLPHDQVGENVSVSA